MPQTTTAPSALSHASAAGFHAERMETLKDAARSVRPPDMTMAIAATTASAARRANAR